MTWDDVYLVNDRLETEPAEAAAKLEQDFSVTFPSGYAEFIERFGAGVFSGFLRIYLPARIRAELEACRSRWKEPLWTEGPLAPEDLSAAVIVGESLQGDELVIHPDHPGTVFVLPRQSDALWEAGDVMEEVLDWLCSSGELVAPILSRHFESNLSRVRVRLDGPPPKTGLLARLSPGPTYDRVRRALVDLKLHDSMDESQPEEGEPCLELFVRDFQGSVTLIEGDRLMALLNRDEDATSAAFDQVRSVLEGFGFRE